jgi:hypothetical protein
VTDRLGRIPSIACRSPGSTCSFRSRTRYRSRSPRSGGCVEYHLRSAPPVHGRRLKRPFPRPGDPLQDCRSAEKPAAVGLAASTAEPLRFARRRGPNERQAVSAGTVGTPGPAAGPEPEVPTETIGANGPGPTGCRRLLEAAAASRGQTAAAPVPRSRRHAVRMPGSEAAHAAPVR